MSVEQLEQSVLSLSREERRHFLDWLYEHESELLGEENDIHPAVKAEVLRRQDEALSHPETIEPVTPEWFEQLKRKLADASPRKASAR